MDHCPINPWKQADFWLWQTLPKLWGSSHGLCWSHWLHFFLVGEEDGRDQSKLETKVWEAHNPLIDKQIDQFLVVAR